MEKIVNKTMKILSYGSILTYVMSKIVNDIELISKKW